MNYLNWFITSSSDPEKVSLTLKSLAVILVLFGVDQSVANEGIGHLINLISSAGMVFSSCIAIYGLLRKFYNGRWAAK